MWANFPIERRYSSMILVADNILVPKVIQTMYKIHKAVDSLNSIREYFFE